MILLQLSIIKIIVIIIVILCIHGPISLSVPKNDPIEPNEAILLHKFEVPIFPVHRSALAFATLVKPSFIGQLLIWFEQVPVCAEQISTFRSANEFNLQSSMFADRLLTEEIEATLAERKI